ncbi:MAG: hypothetical protein LBS57_13975 [Treponema sp.]|nr:hypothetical protein [Treponema sp.]
MLAPLPTEAQQLVIRRVTPKTQTIDLTDNTKLHAELIETIGDKSTMEIQEIFQQTINADNLEELKSEINEAIEIGQEKVETLLALQIAQESTAREAGDSALQALIDEVSIQEDVNRAALESLLQYVFAKLGPLDTISLITESEDMLITEAGTRLIA